MNKTKQEVMDQKEEMNLAEKERRQPKCEYCQTPIEKITMTQYDYIEWEWDKDEGKFVKISNSDGYEWGDSDKPACGKCGNKTWDLLDDESGASMGVSF